MKKQDFQCRMLLLLLNSVSFLTNNNCFAVNASDIDRVSDVISSYHICAGCFAAMM